MEKLQEVKTLKKQAKCKFCGEDIKPGETAKWLVPSHRYAHMECANEHWEDVYQAEQAYIARHNKNAAKAKEKELANLGVVAPNNDPNPRNKIHKLCKDVFKDAYSKKIIDTELDRMMKDGKTLNAIYDAMYDWYIVKKKDPAQAHGRLGIIDYIYIEQTALRKQLDDIKASLETAKDPVTHYVTVNQSSFSPRVKLFDLS